MAGLRNLAGTDIVLSSCMEKIIMEPSVADHGTDC